MFKNGRLFGVINVLDLLLVLMLIAVLVFAVSTQGVPALTGVGVIAGEATYEIRFFAPMVNDFVVENMYIGDHVLDHTRHVSFGTITQINAGPGLEHNPNAEGILVLSPYEGYNSLEVVTEVTLPAGSLNNGLHIHGNRFGVGQTVAIRAGNTLISVRISGFAERN